MKAFLLIAGLALASGSTFAQTTPPAGQEAVAPFKGANVILIHTPDSTSATLLKLARVLLSNGYAVASINKELGFIYTEYRVTQSRGVQVSLRFAVLQDLSGTTIEARGNLKVPGLGATIAAGEAPIEKRGMNGSAYMLAWEELNKAALAYPSGKVGYLKKP